MNESGTWSAHIERLKTVPGLGRDAAALVTMVVIGIVATIGIKGYLGGSAPWSDRTVVKAAFNEIPGLNPLSQNSVTIAGVKVGTVTDAKAMGDGTALITMTLDGSYDVYQNARAVLQPKNPLDEMQVALNPGTSSAPRMSDSSVLPVAQTATPVQADDIFSHLDTRSQVAISDLLTQSGIALADAPTDLPKGLQQTNATLQTLKPVTEQLATRRERLRSLVSDLAAISSAVGKDKARVTQLAEATQSTLGVLAAKDDNLRSALRQLPGLTTELRKAMSGTSKLTTQLNPTLDDLNKASGQLPGALTRFESTLHALDRTMTSAKPVMRDARPVIEDLRPTVVRTNIALKDVAGITGALEGDTRTVMSYLTDIKAFVYNTSSVFGAGDSNGSIIRGHLVVPLPGGGVLPNSLTQGQ